MTISTHTLAATVDGVPLEVTSATVTIDEGWSPYAQTRLTCVLPPSDVLEGIDPRRKQRVLLTLTQSFGEDTPTTLLSFFTSAFGGLRVQQITESLDGGPLSGLSRRLHPWWNPTGTDAETDTVAHLTIEYGRQRVDRVTLDTAGRTLAAITALFARPAYDTAGPTNPTKVLTLKHQTAWPGSGAAARRLHRAAGLGRVLDIDAMSDYGATPGMGTTITMADTPDQSGFISAVSWNIPEDEMRVTTRGLADTLVTSWTFARPGLTWSGIPAGLAWSDYTPY